MSESISHSAIVSFKSRDAGWYEDDPDYYYEGSIGKSYVTLAVPTVPGNYNGHVKITITMEPIEMVEHVWVDCEDGSPNEICLACGVIAVWSRWAGTEYPNTSCAGEH